jgi:hypothetical protein
MQRHTGTLSKKEKDDRDDKRIDLIQIDGNTESDKQKEQEE